MGGVAAAPRVEVRSVYRGWLSQNERGELHLIGEGDLAKVLARDWARFGPDVRVHFFASTVEFALDQVKGHPTVGDFVRVSRDMRARNFDLGGLLRPRVGKFLHLEIEWRR